VRTRGFTRLVAGGARRAATFLPIVSALSSRLSRSLVNFSASVACHGELIDATIVFTSSRVMLATGGESGPRGD
jgi:hypothetical protein